jgi:hypothetical protein
MKKNRPTIVCLCGSTKFKDAFIKATRDETLAGKIVLTVGFFGHIEKLDIGKETRQMLDELHIHKIDMSDEVFILNVGGYIGKSTRREINYSLAAGKYIRYLE